MTTKRDSNTLTIARPNSSTSKIEEIQIITQLHEFFAGTQSYLDSLFTSSMTSWVAQQIKDDGCPDLWDAYNTMIKDAHRDEIDARVAFEKQTQLLNTRTAELENTAAQRDNWKRMHDDAQQQKDALVTQFNRAQSTAAMELQDAFAQQNHLEEKIDEQAAEIIKLKALLWDQSQELAAWRSNK